MKRMLLFTFAIFTAKAGAAVVTFNQLPGANGDAFSSYTESGFNITPASGFWHVAKMFGNPTPDIFSRSQSASISISSVNNSLFSFAAVDLGYNVASYQIDGYLQAHSLFSQSGIVDAGNIFTSISSQFNLKKIDALKITMQPGMNPSFNIDNIDVIPEVPVPASILFFVSSIASLFGARRFKII